MARKIALRVERLEVRELLSSLAYSVTTDKSTYQVGQPVQLTFTETNTSTKPVTVTNGPGTDGFTVTEGGTTIWQSNSGINATYVEQDTLQPGQSLTETATWDGEATASPTVAATGSFTVTNQLAPTAASASFQVQSPVTYNVSTNQANYQVGQPIQLSFTETNPSSSAVSVTVDPPNFTITQAGNTVWTSNPNAASQATTTEILYPGQTITQTGTWDGTSNWLGGQSINNWGAFSVSNPNAPGSTASFQIASPLATTVSTGQSTYAPGQPVVMNFQQTNTSNQTITFLTGATSFNVAQNGSVVYSATTPQVSASETLAPGQSYTQTLNWSGIPAGSSTNTPITGSFVVSNSGAPGVSASFEIPAPTPAPTPTPTPAPTSTPTPTPTTTTSSPTPTSTTSSPTPTSTSSSPTPTSTTSSPTPTSTTASPTPTSTTASPTPTSTTASPTPTSTTTPTPTPTSTETATAAVATAPLQLTLTTSRPTYRRGTAVRLILTLNNTSASTVSLTPNTSTDGITVSLGSTVVWRASRSTGSSSHPLTLESGMSTRLTTTWNGRSNQGGPRRLPPGVYTVEATEGGYTATTTVNIVG